LNCPFVFKVQVKPRQRAWFRAGLALAPAQLAAQGLKEAAFAETHQLDGVHGAVATEFVAADEFDCLLTVYGEQGKVGHSLNADGEAGVAADHDGPEGEQVRADGGDHHGVHVGREDGAVGSQRVGR